MAKRVEAHWPGSSAVLDHVLWKFTGKTRPKLSFAQQTIERYLGKMGLRRMGCQASAIYEQQRDAAAAFDWHTTTLKACARAGDINAMAFLAALMTEAAIFDSFPAILRLLSYFDEAAGNFLSNPTLDYVPDFPELFTELVANFKKRLLPGELTYPDINHLSVIVEDDESGRRVEPLLRDEGLKLVERLERLILTDPRFDAHTNARNREVRALLEKLILR